MYKKLLILSLASGLFFTSCQKDEISEETQTEAVINAEAKSNSDLDGKIHEPDWMEGPGAQIHEPDWMEGPGTSIHTPEWTVESWFECAEESEIPANLVVPSNKEASYSAIENATFLNKINVGGTLNVCGFVASTNTVNLHRGGVFNFVGDMYIGSEEEPADLVINYGSHFNFAGNVMITGDLIVNNGGTLEQMGDHAEIMVGGDIIYAEGAIVKEFE
ncbi:hypothetical protein [Christiangramia salexigens]|uniref:Uncharacterized protein n=1 Tax=Christiangramia salexigens TaxID=1913577 RepID=A0A1L3J6C3_9FLAO|nr:hypothetical protein [Christiangramia salexigens]APG60698.1 hypothetical protein LPB144_09915 [Christiangramia salexigens]